MIRIYADKSGLVTLKTLASPSHPDTAVVCVTSPETQHHERKFARIGVTRAWCGSRYGGEAIQSYARSVASLINDVHSPMDYSPVHARWDVVY